MEQDVLDVFCGTMIPVSHKSNGIFDLFARAAGQNVCIAVMESCHALLVSMFTLAVISAGGATLCVTYWTHEHQIGRVLLAALVVSFVLHGAVVLLWTPYATPTFSPTTFSYGSVEVEMNAPFWTVVFNSCVVLTASMWFTYHLILDQRRRYLNRRHVHQLGKHPLDCPALYA
ncbi:hypothetical protein H310_13414 [Aphanomyces invadans]|uniref:Uncharacterized protein n=1 Tax=Aphanomyces invadans TaxID=157072 RepID=A0A024TFN0_9STRA|nr:hypothetical protein H310_13414 [Aphanomyces invadans]ETV92167.1 hypothetical protein H310_13414 [Aphanomyces invadans]|eukprot:XP_008879131.1 hypothetical protein H310_13414 [Aphanomyces invadans]